MLVQLAGALYVGFAMVNWMAKGNLLGGIYNRAVAMGNFADFGIGAIVLVKGLIAGQLRPGSASAARPTRCPRSASCRRVRIAGEKQGT